MTISVVIPTFNRAWALSRALHSVNNQTFPPHEVIVVDDGSTDNTSNLVNLEFPEVRYFVQENLGVSAARNLGIAESTQPWIAFLDSDDEWTPDKLRIQIQEITCRPEYRVCHSEEIWIRHNKRVNPMKKHAKFGGWIFRRCLPLCGMSASSILIHRSVFDEIGKFDENLPACEDYDLWLRITARFPVLFIDEPLIVKYGGHLDQLSQKHWGMDRFRISALKKILDNGTLESRDEAAVRTMLVHKAKIYSQGALKRNKNEEVEYYQSLCLEYSNQ